MTSSLKRILGNLALLLLTLALTFSLCEFAVRLLYKDSTVLFPRYHTDYQYGRYTIRGIRPNSEFRHTSVDGSWVFNTNNKGFRSTVNVDYAKPAGIKRVLGLGDSHTQGYEVHQEATFSAVLERYLAHRGIKAEVLNAGVSGYSTAEALALLENEGYKYSPDLVVLGFYANDFADNLKAGLFEIDSQGRLTEAKFEHIPGVRIQNLIYAIPPVRWLSENSYFYSLLFNSVWNAFKARLGESVARDADSAGTPFELSVATASAVPPRQIALALALLKRMDQFCRQRGIRLIVVDIPARTGPYRFASSLPPAMLSIMATEGIEVITGTPSLAILDGAAGMHVPHGHHHISELAHALIGTEIGKQLTKP